MSVQLQCNIITLFPNFFTSIFSTSLLGKAVEKGIIEVNYISLRDFADPPHHKTDDLPYGGGAGMVLKVEPIVRALKSITEPTYSICLSPRGYFLCQTKVCEIFSMTYPSIEKKSLTLLCGHYEGIDERVTKYIDASISIGPYILSGGESAAAILIEALSRLVPGFLSNTKSLESESYEKEQYLEYPQYTRPAVFEEQSVPSILLSGHHQKIEEWRVKESKKTYEKFKN